MQITHNVTQADIESNSKTKLALAGSKSLASMLPMLISTGVITLVVSAVTRLLWLGFSHDFYAAWIEAWLTTWPIAFPLGYLGMPFVKRLTIYLATRTAMKTKSTTSLADK